MENQQDITALSPGQAVITLQGASHEIYGFTPFPIDAAPEKAGIFAFAAIAQSGTMYWDLLYIGSDRRIRGRAEWLSEAQRLGATHILVHFCRRGDEVRNFVEEDLIAANCPPLNVQERRAKAA